MEKWEAILRLKLGRLPFPVKVGFTFEWGAWFLAYDETKCGPDEFNALTAEKQITALAFGAASWWCMKNHRRVFFTMEDMGRALMMASKANNILLSQALGYARFPEWMQHMAIEDKKKAES